MSQLTYQDCAELVGLAEEVSAWRDRPDWRRLLLARLLKFVPAEFSGCHVLDWKRSSVLPCYEPALPSYPAFNPEFLALVETHPLTGVLRRDPGRVWKISDVATTAAFRRTKFFHELYRPLGIDHELVTLQRLPGESSRMLVLSLHRRRADFDERERLLLQFLALHAAQLGALRSAGAARHSETGNGTLPDLAAFRHCLITKTPWQLSNREIEVLYWICQGKTNGEIGRLLGITFRTAETHALRLYPKIGVENRYGAISEVLRITHHGECPKREPAAREV